MNAAPLPQRQPKDSRRNRAAQAQVLAQASNSSGDHMAACNDISEPEKYIADTRSTSLDTCQTIPQNISGGALEGGGQILRNTASLSCLLHKPVRVHDIRAGRSKPGLRPQHLTGLNLINDICHGKLEGGRVGSAEIKFYPGPIQSGEYLGDIGTAGSICLLMQVAIPCSVYADNHTNLILKGGTDAEMAPLLDQMLMVFKPIAEKFGMKFDCTVIRRGYFPKGGGEVRITCHPSKQLNAVTMTDRGSIKRVYGRSFVAGVLPIRVAHVMAKVAEDVIHEEYKDVPIKIDVVKEESALGTGTGIVLVAETTTGCFIGGSSLGRKGKQAEQVGSEAGEELVNNLFHGGCVDDYIQDQIILLMALAKGKSEVRCGPLSLHTETAIHVAKQLTEAKFKITEINKGATLIECEGIGLINSQVGDS